MNKQARTIAVFLSLAMNALAAAHGADLKFRAASGPEPVIGRYVVTLDASVAEQLARVSAESLAHAYGGQLELYSSSDVRQFAIAMLPSRARTLSADPRVRQVVEIAQSDPTTTAAPPSPGVIANAGVSPARRLVPGALDSSSTGNYAYDGAGNITAIGSDTFFYDLEARLTQGTVQGSQQSYTYDAFGNRTGATRAAGAAPCVGGCEAAVTVDHHTNHLGEQTYDDAGNVKTGFGASYKYDGTGMVTEATVGSDVRDFVYTADDERLAVRRGTSWTWTVRDQGNKVLREFTSQETSPSPLTLTTHTWSKDYVWRDGLLLASVFPRSPGSSSTTTYHYHLDHLGTPRFVTDGNHVKVAEHVYYPFGAEMNITPHEGAVELMKFTGHERDIVAADNASVDYMHARYYNGNLGRFLSVDPALDLKKTLPNPQAWNRYSYVRNTPIRFTDPTGKYTCAGAVDQCTAVEENVDRLRQAAATLTAQHAPGASALTEAAAFYGKKDERNGVAVTVGDFHGSAAADTEKKNGLVIVTVDAGLLMGGRASRQPAVEMAATFAHESEHGVRLLASNDPGNVRSEVKNDEREAYRWGGYVNAAFKVDSAYHVWEHGAWNHSMLESWAERTTVADCAAMGGCK
jgi:RHS repeat-associated protein